MKERYRITVCDSYSRVTPSTAALRTTKSSATHQRGMQSFHIALADALKSARLPVVRP
jgi:hypothetical protein